MEHLKRFLVSKDKLHFRAISLSDTHFFIHKENRVNMRGVLDFLYHTESDYLFLNGDIFDIWQRMKNPHRPLTEIEARIMDTINEKAMNGTRVIFLEGNHEADHLHNQEGFFMDGLDGREEFEHIEMRRSFDFKDPAGRNMLITHGDQFDPMEIRRLYKIGDLGYRLVTAADRMNPILPMVRLHSRRVFSIAANCKDWTKRLYIDKFENKAISSLPEQYDGVVLGHIHKANLKHAAHPRHPGKEVLYINDGDGTESVSAAVCTHDGEWGITHWFEDRRHLPFASKSLPSIKRPAPEVYQRHRPTTYRQMEIILKTFPAKDGQQDKVGGDVIRPNPYAAMVLKEKNAIWTGFVQSIAVKSAVSLRRKSLTPPQLQSPPKRGDVVEDSHSNHDAV